MRWRFWGKNIVVEPKRHYVDLEKMKHQFEDRGFTVEIVESCGSAWVPSVTPWPTSYGDEPAFHSQYVPVKVGPQIDLSNLRKNANTFKLQAREVVTDPKRVYRRKKRQFLDKRVREQRFQDSRLFV